MKAVLRSSACSSRPARSGLRYRRCVLSPVHCQSCRHSFSPVRVRAERAAPVFRCLVSPNVGLRYPGLILSASWPPVGSTEEDLMTTFRLSNCQASPCTGEWQHWGRSRWECWAANCHGSASGVTSCPALSRHSCLLLLAVFWHCCLNTPTPPREVFCSLRLELE